jgi:hypothetical protein
MFLIWIWQCLVLCFARTPKKLIGGKVKSKTHHRITAGNQKAGICNACPFGADF